MTSRFVVVALTLATVLVAACSGGGSSPTAPTQTSTQPPEISVTPPQIGYRGFTVVSGDIIAEVVDVGMPGRIRVDVQVWEPAGMQTLCVFTTPRDDRTAVVNTTTTAGMSPLTATLPYDGTRLAVRLKRCDVVGAAFSGGARVVWMR